MIRRLDDPADAAGRCRLRHQAAAVTTRTATPGAGRHPARAAARRAQPVSQSGGARPAGGFGRPAFVRKDGGTEMWRYDGAACRAFFFLYGTPPAVRHVETLPHGAQSAADMACLNALKASPAKAS